MTGPKEETMSSELGSSENPRKWRYTWEAQSHIPTLRLFLFNTFTNPKKRCKNLKIVLNLEESLVLVSWFEDTEVTLRVPIPRVLVDVETPLCFRTLDDHVEVKLVLLLPVDHPIFSELDFALNLSEDELDNISLDVSHPLSMDSDVKILSSMGGVHFYCRSCSTKLTKSPISHFVEMPSANWREAADNWFGSCCCSFGGASEKLVTRYMNSYSCADGTCLLNNTSIILSKDDLVQCKFPDRDGSQNSKFETAIDGTNGLVKTTRDDFDGKESRVLNRDNVDCCSHDVSVTCSNGQELTTTIELSDNQKSLLNGFLGDLFMVRSSYLSKDVEWIEFVCPGCSSLLGAYPCGNGHSPLDGGVRLFKCYISTFSPVGGSSDVFRKYTLERMFTNQLMESAKDELSFRTVIRDLRSKSCVLQIVLLNPNSWYCSGYCWGKEGSVEPVLKFDMCPVTKVLFSVCSESVESQSRMIEEWVAKNEADEVYMLRGQIEELIESLESAKDLLPSSFAFLQDLPLSSLHR